MNYRNLYPEYGHLAAFWIPSFSSTLAGFYLRTVFQVAACVYSTGLLENLGKKKNQQCS